MNDSLGKDAERKIKEWLDHPDLGYSFDRIPDQMTGFFGSKNICDFICFKSPYFWYIESKATYDARFDFSMITDTQMHGLLEKSSITNVFCVIIILFASYKRTFILEINQIKRLIDSGKKSINIKKIDSWNFKYSEIQTIANSRKKLLDYTGGLEDHIGFIFDDVEQYTTLFTHK